MKIIPPLNDPEVAFFCGQLSMLLQAGITPDEGVHLLLQDAQADSGQALLEQLQEHLGKGESLEDAVKAVGVFPDYVEHMISLGERSGNLDRVLASLAKYYEQSDSLRKSVKSAVAYPCLMILMMLFVIIVLLTRVLPIFQQVFHQLGSEMNAFSVSLLQAGNALKHGSYLFLFLAALFGAAIVFFSATGNGRKLFSHFLSRFGPTRKIYEAVAAGRFASGMSMALGSGLDTYESLDLVSSLISITGIRRKIENCRSYLQGGASFAEALSRSRIFSALYARMAAVGFRTGSSETVMAEIAARYEEEADRRIQSALSVLEPSLVILLSLIVGLILLSVILPLMGIMSSIG